MTRHSVDIQALAGDTFGGNDLKVVTTLATSPYALEPILLFDDELGGASMSRLAKLIAEKKINIADRDVFRPLQYCEWEFKDFGVWDSRQVVYMSSLHLESLVKRISRQARSPLGIALQHSRVRQKIAPATYSKIERLVTIYNSAKHDMDHDFGTHLFSQEDAIYIYFVARKLGMRLYELAGLKTDIRLFRRKLSA